MGNPKIMVIRGHELSFGLMNKNDSFRISLIKVALDTNKSICGFAMVDLVYTY